MFFVQDSPLHQAVKVSDTNRIVCYDRDGRYQPLLSNIEALGFVSFKSKAYQTSS